MSKATHTPSWWGKQIGEMITRSANITLERTAGSHVFAAGAQRERCAQKSARSSKLTVNGECHG